MVQAIDQEIKIVTKIELSHKLDTILDLQIDTREDISAVQTDIRNLHEGMKEYKQRVDRIEARQWKISSFTGAVAAFIAWFLKGKQG